MTVEVEAPNEIARAVIADMDNRRISLLEVGGRTIDLRTIVTGGDATVIHGDAPLARLLGYAEALRSISAGRAICTISFSRYAEVPRDDGPENFSPAIGTRA
jgi:elongation factor G